MNSQFDDAMLERIEASGVIAVLVLDEVQHAVPLAKALLDGGIDVMELTLRTPAALEGLKKIRNTIPEMLAGIGTILTPDQVADVVDAGGAFGVAPGLNPRVVKAAQEKGLPFAPGVATPSDVELAIELGCREQKFFPAEPIGGLKYLKSMAAPYSHLGLQFVPLGGINAGNLKSYLSESIVRAVGGSWIAPRAVIAAEDWSTIVSNAAEAKRIASEAN